MISNLKTICRSLALTAACGALSLASAHAAEPSPAIRIDGQLDDAAWKKARPLEAFKTVELKTLRGVVPAGQKPQAQTTGLFFTDANYLYLGFRCEEPLMEKLEARTLPRDGSIWTNDCIEIFIAPFQRTDAFFQIAVDVAGQIFDTFKNGRTLDSSYDISVVVKTQKQRDGWTMEMAIPLSEVGLSNARHALINFGRERKPVNELSSWHGDFGKPETWQKMPLALDKRYDVDASDWNFGPLQYGENELSLEFVTTSVAPLGVLLQTQENGKWQNQARITTRSTPGLNRRFTLPYALSPQRKPQSLRLTLERSGQPVFRVTRRLALPAEALLPALSVPYYYAEENFGLVRLQNFLSPIGLQKSHLRLTVKNPAGKTVVSREIRDLRPTMQAGFDISSWREGDGTLTAELLSDGQTLSTQTVIIEKRPGPFSMLAGR